MCCALKGGLAGASGAASAQPSATQPNDGNLSLRQTVTSHTRTRSLSRNRRPLPQAREGCSSRWALLLRQSPPSPSSASGNLRCVPLCVSQDSPGPQNQKDVYVHGKLVQGLAHSRGGRWPQTCSWRRRKSRCCGSGPKSVCGRTSSCSGHISLWCYADLHLIRRSPPHHGAH